MRCRDAAALLGALSAGTAAAADPPSSAATMLGREVEAPEEGVTGDWGGARSRLENGGLAIFGNFTAETAGNPTGGQKQGFTEAGQFTVGSMLDTDKVFGLSGGTLQASATWREGAPILSEALQQPQEIYGRGNIVRLTEFWYEQSLAGGAVTVKLGRMPQGDFNSFTCYFMSLAFCGSPSGNILGGYLYNWPVSQWAGWAKWAAGDVALMAGASESNPRDIDRTFMPGLIDGADGVIGRAEIEWVPKFGTGRLQGRYQAGLWYDTAGGSDVLDPALHRAGRYGYYIQAVQQVTGTGEVDPKTDWHGVRGISLFFNYLQADQATSPIDSQVTAGLFYAAPFDGRPNDHLGFAAGRTHSNYRAVLGLGLLDPAAPRPGTEYELETYYSYLAAPWLALRPDVQYVIHPGGYPAESNALVLGARTVLTF